LEWGDVGFAHGKVENLDLGTRGGLLPVLWDFLTSDFPPHKRFHMPLRHNKQQIYYVAQYSSMKLSIEHCVSLCLTCSISNPFDGSSTCITDRLKNDHRKLGMITLLECYRDLFWTRGLKTPKNGQTSAFPIHFPSISHPFPIHFPHNLMVNPASLGI